MASTPETRYARDGDVHPQSNRVLSTVLFTDIVGSTELAAALGDGAWTAMLAAHD